ncbi:hypothetical protein [Arthrobacter sp. U41]|uniref:hypothetical protein n=1 Tax=Arthrobacter sp. U41 TaxID=1849032 RepID=UPI0018D42D35|nr:hypothetical protein [Arthrobacter sp. U41]
MPEQQAPGIHRTGFLLRWWLLVTLAESIGFLAPAAVGVAVALPHPELSLVSLGAAGVVEGAVLGFAQARVLKRRLPGLSVPGWTVRTAVAAPVAWLIGMSAGQYAEVWLAWPAAVQFLAGVAAALLLLCSLGLAQWPELRRHIPRSGWWIPGSAAAWCGGLAVFFAVAPPLWEAGQPPAVALGIGTGAGILMAATAALISGLVMARLLHVRPAGVPAGTAD